MEVLIDTVHSWSFICGRRGPPISRSRLPNHQVFGDPMRDDRGIRGTRIARLRSERMLTSSRGVDFATVLDIRVSKPLQRPSADGAKLVRLSLRLGRSTRLWPWPSLRQRSREGSTTTCGDFNSDGRDHFESGRLLFWGAWLAIMVPLPSVTNCGCGCLLERMIMPKLKNGICLHILSTKLFREVHRNMYKIDKLKTF